MAVREKHDRIIMLADCQSFYASVEKAAHPEYRDKPLIVAGDPARRSGVVLAACPLAKGFGIQNAETLGDALGKCPDAIVVRPRMQAYIETSLLITRTLERFTDLVEPFSIDEQFLDVTGSMSLYGSPFALARNIQTRVLAQTGVWVRVGISTTKVLAKMACDLYAKKSETGIRMLLHDELHETLWPRPVRDMFGVAGRMSRHFQRMGLSTIGDVARLPLPELQRRMRLRFGKDSDIMATVYWRTARGLDDSPVSTKAHDGQKSIGHGMTLPRDYESAEEINAILLELCDEVCRRSRAKRYMGHILAVSMSGGVLWGASGFGRQMKMVEPTNVSSEIYPLVKQLFYEHWDGSPVRRLGVTLGGLVTDQHYQMSLGDHEQRLALERTMDALRDRYGTTALLRATSYTPASQAHERAAKIGGHYR